MPTSSSQFEGVSTEMNTLEMKDSITAAKGPTVDALSVVVVNAVTAMPSAPNTAAPRATQTARPTMCPPVTAPNARLRP